MSKPLIEVKDLKVYFKQKSPKLLSFKPGILKAVDQVSFSIEKGKTFGLVGESGSGKSTIGKAILRYHKPTGGEIFYEGTEIGAMGEKELLPYRKKMQSFFRIPIPLWTQAIQCRISSVSLWRSIKCTLQRNVRSVQKN